MHFCQSLIVGDEQSLAESGIGGKYLMCEKHALLARRDFFVRLCEADFATGHLAHLKKKLFFPKTKTKRGEDNLTFAVTTAATESPA